MLRLAVLTRLVTDTDCLMNSSINAHVSLLQNTKKENLVFWYFEVRVRYRRKNIHVRYLIF